MSPQTALLLLASAYLGFAPLTRASEIEKPMASGGIVKVEAVEDNGARALMLKELSEQSGWMKVYAAEWLLEAGQPEDRATVRDQFLAIEQAGPHPGTEQAGIWRVLAQVSEDEARRAGWVERLTALSQTPEEPRRLHAVETLCKLGEVSPEVAQSAREWMRTGPEANAPFCAWSMVISKGALEAERVEALARLKQQLGAELPVVRIRAAFTLGQLAIGGKGDDSLCLEIAEALRAALPGVTDAALKHQLQCALYLSSGYETERAALRALLLRDLFTTPNSARLIATTLAGSLPPSTKSDLTPRLVALMESDHFHHRWAAARLLAARPVEGAEGVGGALNTALQAESKPGEWWGSLHQKYVDQAKAGKIDLLFIGDSITQYWSDSRYGQKVWEQEFAPLKAANFGIAGDRIQHMLWRLRNGEGEGFSPKVIVLLAGTNNVAFEGDGRTLRNEASEVIAGMEALVGEIRERFPDSRLLVLGILPRGKPGAPVRSRVAMVNAALAKMHDGVKLFYLDIGEAFLDEDDAIPADVMPDALHPNEKGYQIFADAIKPTLLPWLSAPVRQESP